MNCFRLLFIVFLFCKANNSFGQDLKHIDTLISYSEGTNHLSVSLKSFGKFGYKLSYNTLLSNKWKTLHSITLNYPVYHFEVGDINGDGRKEILLGVIKTTHFDPVSKKRLFIYKFDKTKIRPLWMGSRVQNELVD